MDQEVHPHQALADRFASVLRQNQSFRCGQPIGPLAHMQVTRPFRKMPVRFREDESMLLPPGSAFPILDAAGLFYSAAGS